MKTIYSIFILAIFAVSNLYAQTTWENFEDIRKGDYFFNNGTFIPYFTNPDQTGANTSEIAAQYTRNAAELFDVITIDGAMADLSDYVSGTKTLSIDVWSPAVGKTVQITLENKTLAQPANFPTGRHSVYLATTSVANAWETLTFVFDNQPDVSVGANTTDRLVLLFDPNSNNSDTYYWDNLNGPEFDNDPCAGTTTDPEIFNDFECDQNVNFTFSHGANSFRRLVNPDASGVNTSSHVATYSRNAGEENDVIVGNFRGTIPAPTANNVVQLDVWDGFGSTPIRIALQDAQGNDIDNLDATTSSAASQWQTLNFNLDTAVGNANIAQFVILFNPGTFTADQFYFDNFKITTPSGLNKQSLVNKVIAYPNPSAGQVAINYELKESSMVNITISDITGKVIKTITNENQKAGQNSAVWNSENSPNGVYFYSINAENNQQSGKLIINK